MRNAITSQLVRHNRSRMATVRSQQPRKEALSRLAIALLLHEYINDFSILIHGTPQIVRLSVDLDKDLIEIESIPEPPVPAL